MKQLRGQSVALAQKATAPVNGSDKGTDLVAAFADKTATWGLFKPKKFYITATLTGGTSTNLVLWVHDPVVGWLRPVDSGNFGLLGGDVLPTGSSYVFEVDNLGPYDAAVVVLDSNTGAVVVTNLNLVAIIEKDE